MKENIKILSPIEIDRELVSLPGWQLEAGKRIKKTFQFDTFGDGIKFISEMVPFYNELDHHPDIKINYKKVTFELTRYDIGEKLTDLDFKVAREIEKNYSIMYPSSI